MCNNTLISHLEIHSERHWPHNNHLHTVVLYYTQFAVAIPLSLLFFFSLSFCFSFSSSFFLFFSATLFVICSLLSSLTIPICLLYLIHSLSPRHPPQIAPHMSHSTTTISTTTTTTTIQPHLTPHIKKNHMTNDVKIIYEKSGSHRFFVYFVMAI